MSGREWQPGDVAVATFDHGGSGFVFRVVGATTSWCDMAGVSVPADQITDARPLVVIDPEDREQVERLSDALAEQRAAEAVAHSGVADALRSLTRPPKPEEPTGLGAVVEDAEGLRWVRKGNSSHGEDWTRQIGDAWTGGSWDRIAAVRVLSEGVTQ
jgi:hypothetical protein